jgi:hypothetical protein
MNTDKLGTQDVMKIATTGFAVYSVLKTVRAARRDDDGLQLMEALLRGATLTLSIILIIRNLRGSDDLELEGSEGLPA